MQDIDHPDSLKDDEEPKSAALVLDALKDAEREFQPYWDFCRRIDDIAGMAGNMSSGRGYFYSDQEFDLFWASMEIMKPAIYARPPKPVVSPRFADRDPVAVKASELLERCLCSSFERGDFNEVMLNVRDDLAFSARGVSRVLYESDAEGGGQRVCDEHVDRLDFLHEPARKWPEVGWVAFAAYMTERELKKRFPSTDVTGAQYNKKRDRNDTGVVDTAAKCKVWEVWHKADDRVYWVAEGVETFLDDSAPFLTLDGFFPCPRPAYGTVKRRTLIPVPDYGRYEKHLDQINELTRRVYSLLEWVKVKGLIAAGGDIGNAVETALAQSSDDVLLIPVPAAALIQGAAGQLVQFLPLQDFATAVQGLLEARREMINNFYELSGISDIMRGATDAQETLGAQQLKSQYGSVRVRDKVDELQRLARDAAQIAAEIMSQKFSQKTLLEMSQLQIPTKAEVKAQLKQIEANASKEMDALEKKAEEAQASGQQVDPAPFEQKYQEIIQQASQAAREASQQVVIEDVIDLLRDKKARAFTIEIETDSTIMTDELQEKSSRTEFLTAFASASQAVQPLLMAGEAGAKLAGGMLKFVLAPYRAGRELDGMIDDFVEKAPGFLAQQGNSDAEAAMAAANDKLADAELQKAKAATMKVEADGAAKSAEHERKIGELQLKAQSDSQQFNVKLADAQAKSQAAATQYEKVSAEIDKMRAETAKILSSIGLDERKQHLSEYTAATNEQARATDQAMSADQAAQDAERADRGEARADRQQDFGEQQGSRSDERADRQQEFAETQAQKEPV